MGVKVLIVGAAVLFSGCSMFSENVDYQHYAAALQQDSVADATSIASQAKAITTALENSKPATDTERILLAVIAMDRIASLHPTPLNIDKPIGGYDVLQAHAGTLVSAGVTGFLGYMSYDTIKAFAHGLGTYNFNNDGDVGLENSLNYDEQHFTGADNNTGTLARDQVSND